MRCLISASRPECECGDKCQVQDMIDDAVAAERSACLRIAAEYGGRDADEIAEMIGKRSFT